MVNAIQAPIHVSDEAFERAVLQSPVPVLVDFWAPWCGPCRMIAPTLEQLAREYAGRVIVAKVNTDDHPQWALRYGVQGIPTMLFIVNGQVVDRIVGVTPAPVLKERLNKIVQPAGV
jgi:thioredoxin 1